jgi:hypothetical protein
MTLRNSKPIVARCEPCLKCGAPVNWSERRRLFGLLHRNGESGLTKDEAAALMPRCSKCATELLIKSGFYGERKRRRKLRPRSHSLAT